MFARFCTKKTAANLGAGLALTTVTGTVISSLFNNDEGNAVTNQKFKPNYVFIDDSAIPFREIEEEVTNTPKL